MLDLIAAHGDFLAGYLTALNILSFGAMGVDKRKSKKKGAYRIPEKTLFLLAGIGGAAGAVLGMFLFRHKTKHWYFAIGLPTILILWMIALIWLFVLR